MGQARVIILFLVLAVIVAGCFSPAGVVAPISSNPPHLVEEIPVTTGTSAIAIASGDAAETTGSPEAAALFRQGCDAMSRPGGSDDAIAFFDAALAIDRNYTGAWMVRGVALHNLHRFDEAVQSYDRALELLHSDPALLRLRCLALESAGRIDEDPSCRQVLADCRQSSASG